MTPPPTQFDSWHRWGGWAWFAVAMLLFIGGGVVLALSLTLPPARSTVHLARLSAPVDVTVDRWGVPRIHAATEADAAAALGYLHARDRMFQMELMRRQASGRLAEIAGARAVPLDRMARILGERRHAEKSYAALSPELRGILTAYSAGVNAWIAERGRLAAPEFLVLGAPEPWTPVDCLLWSETVSLWLSDNYRTELARAALKGKIAPERILELWPQTAGTAAPDSSVPAIRQGVLDALPAFPAPFTLPRRPPTPGPLMAGTQRPDRRCWRATRIWRWASRASGIWPESRRRRACWWVRRHLACRSW